MDRDKAIRAAKLTLGGMLEKKRHTTAVSRADGQIAPSKYLPNVPRAVHADGGRENGNPSFTRDNPGGEWLEGKQARASQYPDRKFIAGAITGVIGGRSSMFLPTHILKGIAGLNDEVRTEGNYKYDDLLSDAQKGGFDHNQKGNKVVVAVNHYGQPYLLEGNTRVAVAHSLGIPKVKAEVRYWNGAENVDGPMHPDQVFGMASDSPEIAKAEGGAVGKAAFQQGNHPLVPDVVYHGTQSDIRTFRQSQTGEFGPGIYATDLPEEASEYAGTHPFLNKGPNVLPLHLSMKNPFVVKSDPQEFWRRFGGKSDQEAQKNAIAAGHDGVIFRRPYMVWDDQEKREVPTEKYHTHFVAFDPRQVKSAIGNQGTFDPTDPDMTKAEGGAVNAPMFQGIHPDLQGDNGAPIDLYHGTPQDKEFEAFDNAKLGERDSGFYGRGHYLTPDRAGADEYANSGDTDGTTIGPLHTALKNPYIWDVSSDMKAHSTLRDLQSMGIMKEKSKLDPWDNLQRHHIAPFMAEMQKRGHDGVIVNTGNEDMPNGISEVVAFNPNTIKHTEAEVFDPNDPRIRRDDGGRTGYADGGEGDGDFEVGQKYNGVIPQIKYLPVHAIERQPSEHEVSRVSDDVAKNMDFSEPVEATAFRYNSNHSEDHPSVALQNGHHRLAAARQTGRPHLPVTLTAVNAKGEKLNALKALSDEIERSMAAYAQGGRIGYGNGGKSLGLYSKAAQIIRNQPQAKGNVDQLLAMVSKAKGVKPVELTNAGRPAGDTMSKEELAQHFEQALPKVDVERIGGRDSNAFPQYEQYTLPGGENYREHLLHLSDDREPPKALHRVMGAFPRDFDSEDGARQYIRQLDTMRRTPGMEGIAESLTRYPAIYQREEGRSTDPNDFKSSHWATPNVLAHVRMSDRDNGKTLHVHEVQSDWGQEGREKGFSTGEKGQVTQDDNGDWKVTWPDGNFSGGYSEESARRVAAGNGRGVPNGPYVGNTQQWTDLALKHILTEAAKGGHDRVVFSPGEANADMYGQRKEVSKLEFLKSNDSGEAGILSGFTPNGYYSSQHDVESHADLSKLIGKENAERLLAQPPTPSPDKGEDRYTHTLQGPLTVGGQGMVDYYKNYAHAGALKLLQQHDPSIKPESYDLPNDYKGFALPMTDTARQSILKNGFQAFQRGGTVGKATGGEIDGENSMDDNNNVTNLSTVRTKRDITSGDHSYGAQNMFADLADKYAESQKAFDMARASGAFDNFQMGDMFKYNGLPNYDPEKIVGFTVKHVSSSPNMTKLFNNHYPALEFETQDADRKVTTVPLEWFENNLHKYDKVGGRPRIVKGGGGSINKALALTRGFTKDGKSAIDALKPKGK